MKTIGLIGGMSWRSSMLYYRFLNEEAARLLGGFHSAESIMYSVDSQAIAELQHSGDWEEATRVLVSAAQALQTAGAELLLICSNTMHLMADDVAAQVDIPLLHSADVISRTLSKKRIERVGFLGTRFTMDRPFYIERLQAGHRCQVLLPPDEHREEIHRIVYEELTLEEVLPSSRATYVDVINGLVREGAEAIVLACTEMSILITSSDVSVELLDTTELHARTAVREALRTRRL